LAFQAYGLTLGTDSGYGTALIKAGSTHDKLALEQLNLAQKLKDGFVGKLEMLGEDQKEYEHIKKKLENRRLDFDAKLNQVQKAKKEAPKLEEETRVAQMKYEETMSTLTQKMIDINATEVRLMILN
jgi:hypothetical protein